MFTSGAAAAVLSVPRAVTIAYYLSTLIVVCVSLSLGIAVLRARNSNGSTASRSASGLSNRRRTRGSGGRSRTDGVLERGRRVATALAERILAAVNRNQRDRL